MDTTKYNHNALRNNIDTLGMDVLALKDLLYFKGTVEESDQVIVDKDRMKGFDYIVNITVDRIKDEVDDLETIIYDLVRSQKNATDKIKIENNNQAINEGIQ
ncbi:hypothetical protein [Anaerococcus hydrogenalis]|uniref:hypothetical protein n=1 Tax=Anaerococcus hydrogenalis TaxID=33029 RepID=UPI0028FFBF40|nr:hypothetical protein [Anaerococcus hydrogenalis]MDU1316909.1 hypothetical protein [Anaerococcus hydrogenalis]